MPLLILGLGLLIGAILLSRWFVSADPRAMAKIVRVSGVAVAVAVVLFLTITGRWGIAVVVGSLLFPLIMNGRAVMNRLKAARGPTAGQTSSLNTEYLSVALDHDTGDMLGTVLKGRYAGASLAELSFEQLLDLLMECRVADPQSSAVLEAYLDRSRGPEWRDAAAGADTSTGSASRSQGSQMTREEAYRLLGLEPGASDEEIKRAHRRLMMQFHPDQGGTDEIAARLNQAKDILLGS